MKMARWQNRQFREKKKKKARSGMLVCPADVRILGKYGRVTTFGKRGDGGVSSEAGKGNVPPGRDHRLPVWNGQW